jgi:imidazolonepropionase-like amidohydrolase
VIRGDRVWAVMPAADAPSPTDARTIDLSGWTVLPGLIDCHAHLIGDIEGAGVPSIDQTEADETLLGVRHARDTLMAGFTTCRDMGPTWPYTDVDLRDAIAAGAVPGPRMFVAGNYVSSTGGAGDARQFSIFVDVPVVKNLADGPEEVTKAVRTNFKHGADFIKILATGAVLSVGISPGAQQYSDAEIQAAVTEARRWGRQVAAHAHGASGIKATIRAGVRTVDHGSYLDDEAISLLKANPTTYYVPTLYLTEVVEDETLSPHVPASEKARAHQIRDVMYAGFKRALAAGIPIGLGTDSAVIPHGRNARELATRVRLGESPMAALVAATRVNAEILGWSDRVGTVEAGKWADIIAAPGDPLRDISVLDRVSFVMKAGAIYREPSSPP